MLKNAGLGSLSILGSLGITVLNLIVTIVGMSLVDRIGRKPLLLFGLIGIIVGELFLGSLQFFHLAAETKGILSLIGLLIFYSWLCNWSWSGSLASNVRIISDS